MQKDFLYSAMPGRVAAKAKFTDFHFYVFSYTQFFNLFLFDSCVFSVEHGL